MPVSIYSNISSLDAQGHLGVTQASLQDHMGRLASGLRVRTAVDDAAAMGIAVLFNARVRSYAQAARNTNDGISLLQTAEGSLAQIHGVLTRLRELAVQSANGTYGSSDRANISVEVQQLQLEIDRIATSTRFGNISVLNAASTVTLQVGPDGNAGDQIAVAIPAADANTLTVDVGGLKVDTQTGALDGLNRIDNAILAVSSFRASLGAIHMRLEVARSNDTAFGMNLAAATSRLRDADIAEEAAHVARENVLMQAGVAVLAQANQSPQVALTLLRN